MWREHALGGPPRDIPARRHGKGGDQRQAAADEHRVFRRRRPHRGAPRHGEFTRQAAEIAIAGRKTVHVGAICARRVDTRGLRDIEFHERSQFGDSTAKLSLS